MTKKLKTVQNTPAAKTKRAAKSKPAEVFTGALAWAVANMKKPTKKDARALCTGDLIEVYYNDDSVPVIEVVIERCEKDEDIFRVRTMTLNEWNRGSVRPSERRGPRTVNSDYWKRLPHRANIAEHNTDMTVYEQRNHLRGGGKPRIEYALTANTRDGEHLLIPITKKQALMLERCVPTQG